MARPAALSRRSAALPVYLADSSIWIGARRNPKSYLTTLAALDRDWQTVWSNLRWLLVGQAEMDRALALLVGLAHTTAGAHRRRPIDYMIAACAESRGDVVVWHWDRDLSVICDHAGVPHEPEHVRAKAEGIEIEPGAARSRPR